MVHLSPDSRLLVSLVKQEQAYASHIHRLLNASGTSLSALSVYASSSPPTLAPVLKGVAGALSGANEAYRTYGESVNDWIDQLCTIKQREEEVSNIARDREILVTRLLKVSQKSKAPPPSLLHVSPDTSSNSSFPILNSKITAAQTELQACESHLAEKELELDKFRINTLRQGLKLRCDALVQCGWAWEEMGRRALLMLEELNETSSEGNGLVREYLQIHSSLSRDHDRDSVLSSLSPSQSASQMGASPHSPPRGKPYRLDIPPAHLMSEQATIPHRSSLVSREPEAENASSSEDDRPLEVHENPRFQPSPILNRQKAARAAPSSSAPGSPISFPSPIRRDSRNTETSQSSSPGKTMFGRDRKGSSLFGSISSLFKTSLTGKTMSPNQSNWNTRTNQNLRSVKTDVEESSDDEGYLPRSGKLRKGKQRTNIPDDGDRLQRSSALLGAGTAPLTLPSPSVTSTRSSPNAKLNRNSSVRSTLSDSASTPLSRGRSITLTPSTMHTIHTNGRGQGSRGHIRTSSADHPWQASNSTAGSLHSSNSSPAWKPPKQTRASKQESLMSIVEGVSEDISPHALDGPNSRLELARAPGRQLPSVPILVHPLPLSSSAPTSPTKSFSAALSPTTPVRSSAGRHVPSTEKKPLRSALRNPNRDRSVSPVPSQSPTATSIESGLSSSSAPFLPTPNSTTQRPLSISRIEVPSTIIESPRQSIAEHPSAQTGEHPDSDGTPSVSSYETGRENFDDEPEPTMPPASAPAQKAVEAPLAVVLAQNTAASVDKVELSSATSTDTATGVARRKSVRMSSLPPQVSRTPPALDEYDDDRLPWGGSKSDASTQDRTSTHKAAPMQKDALRHEEGWKSRIPNGTVTSWADSSSEDEEYKAARELLNRASRRFMKNK